MFVGSLLTLQRVLITRIDVTLTTSICYSKSFQSYYDNNETQKVLLAPEFIVRRFFNLSLVPAKCAIGIGNSLYMYYEYQCTDNSGNTTENIQIRTNSFKYANFFLRFAVETMDPWEPQTKLF